MVATVVLTIEVALGLVFDPRYKDFPFAPFTAAILPFFVNSFVGRGSSGRRGVAELSAAAILAVSVIYILPNEGMANWQSLWLCAIFVAFATTLVRVRGAPS
jgi:glucan 1,3-beta-glucosidase